MAKKKRKTSVTKKALKAIRDAKKNKLSSYKSKKTVRPGPWTEAETKLKVKVNLRTTVGIIGDVIGSYLKEEQWFEPGWYPILFNITSKSMVKDIKKHGLDNYLAACEKSLSGKKEYGTVIILDVIVDHSGRDGKNNKFISVRAKTNKKSIVGFSSIRKGLYLVIGEKQ